jgi:hypothetical protein
MRHLPRKADKVGVTDRNLLEAEVIKAVAAEGGT